MTMVPERSTTPSSGVRLPQPPGARHDGEDLSSGDFNGDGKPDAVVRDHVTHDEPLGQLLLAQEPTSTDGS